MTLSEVFPLLLWRSTTRKRRTSREARFFFPFPFPQISRAHTFAFPNPPLFLPYLVPRGKDKDWQRNSPLFSPLFSLPFISQSRLRTISLFSPPFVSFFPPLSSARPHIRQGERSGPARSIGVPPPFFFFPCPRPSSAVDKGTLRVFSFPCNKREAGRFPFLFFFPPIVPWQSKHSVSRSFFSPLR